MLEKFKSKFNGLTYVMGNDGRCYVVDNAVRHGERISKKVKRRISRADYEAFKALNCKEEL